MKKRFHFLFKSKKRIAVVLLILIIGGFFFFRIRGTSQEKPQYQTAAVEKTTLISSVSASGTILSSNITNVTTQASGTVAKVYVETEEKVSKGQIIAKINLDLAGLQNQSQAYASYLSAKSALASSEANYYTLQSAMFTANQKFMKDAVFRNLVTDDPVYIEQKADWLAAEQKFINNQLDIDKGRATLGSSYYTYQQTKSIITAPTSGIIASLSIAEGMSLSAETGSSGGRTSQAVAIIASEGTPLSSFNVSEIDIPKIKTGQKATIILDSIADKTFTGKVSSINKIGTTNNNVTSYPVIIKFDTASEQVLPNMAATVNIIIASKSDVLTVPLSALQYEGSQASIRVLKNGVVQNVPVETGLSSDTEVEIVSGLNEGDEVITGSQTTSSTTQNPANQNRGGFFAVPGGARFSR